MIAESDSGKSDERPKKSGQQIAKEYVEKVRAYVDGLEQRGERLPGHRGQPNWTAIALACGFARGVFHTNPTAIAVIDQAAENPKLKPDSLEETKQPTESGRTGHTQKKLERKERDVQRLEEQLAVKNAENESLRRTVKELEEKLRQLSAFEEVMVASGRRFIP